ncbi:hypothetical protein ACFYN3_35980 [Streptomyces lavendulae]|uniref:hypothetical protein n=1 Tax=Streptomyces lavendulae TaxID=1914 RepID=UPI0036905517
MTTTADTRTARTVLEQALTAAGIRFEHDGHLNAGADWISVHGPLGSHIIVSGQHGVECETGYPAYRHDGWGVTYSPTGEAEDHEEIHSGPAAADLDTDTAAAVTAIRSALRDAYASTGLATVHTYMDLSEHVDAPTAVDRGVELVLEAARVPGHEAPMQAAITDAIANVLHAATADHHDAAAILHRALTYARTTDRPAPTNGLDDTAFAGAIADLLTASAHHTPGGSWKTACEALAQFTDEAAPSPLTIPQQHTAISV